MNRVWFKRFGWIYRPASWEGAIVVGLALCFCVQVFRVIDRHSHSASDTLYNFFPYVTCCFLMLNWVAANSCGDKDS
jgi:hypothetical protein